MCIRDSFGINVRFGHHQLNHGFPHGGLSLAKPLGQPRRQPHHMPPAPGQRTEIGDIGDGLATVRMPAVPVAAAIDRWKHQRIAGPNALGLNDIPAFRTQPAQRQPPPLIGGPRFLADTLDIRHLWGCLLYTSRCV